jgi:hypothetical protein
VLEIGTGQMAAIREERWAQIQRCEMPDSLRVPRAAERLPMTFPTRNSGRLTKYLLYSKDAAYSKKHSERHRLKFPSPTGFFSAGEAVHERAEPDVADFRPTNFMNIQYAFSHFMLT